MDRLQNEELNRRLNTIALNAVREAQVALGRGHMPWIDDDWRRMDMISKVLNLHTFEHEVEAVFEHHPLVAPVQAPRNEKLDGLETKLADALNLAPEIAPVRAKLPQSKAA
jgi:hypothetical protein